MLINLLHKKSGSYFNQIYTGTKTGVYTDTQFTYPSSIDEQFNSMEASITYDNGLYNMPILVLNHGWASNMLAFYTDTRKKFASYGYFVICPNLRGRPATTYIDASAREIYDIYDAVQYVRTNYPTRVSSTRAGQSGYSGGGGNALATALKFPDLFDFTVSNFGMSDYGYTQTGWYYTDDAYQAPLTNYIGGTPISVPGRYRSRNAREGINNYVGKIFLFHDDEDVFVNVVHSREVYSLFNGSKYYNESNAESAIRWTHDHPNIGTDIEQSEIFWKDYIFTVPKRNIPSSGSLNVRGYCVTNSFKILLGNLNDHASDVVYNCNTGVFTVTPLTGEQSVSLTFNDETQTQTIGSETTFQF